MLHALHGNFGTPADWEAALPPGFPARRWNLWEIRRQHAETATLAGFADWLNQQATPSSGVGAAQLISSDLSDLSVGSGQFSRSAQSMSAPRILAGYSLGARLALHALTARPDLWQAAMLLAPHPGLPDPGERAARLLHDQTWAARCRQSLWPELLEAWNTQPVLADGPPPSASESWRTEIASAFDGWSLGHQPDLLPALAKIKVPILWITGAKDLKFTALAAQAAAVSPNIQHHILPHCGHRLLQQAAAEIRALILHFLEDLPHPGQSSSSSPSPRPR